MIAVYAKDFKKAQLFSIFIVQRQIRKLQKCPDNTNNLDFGIKVDVETLKKPNRYAINAQVKNMTQLNHTLLLKLLTHMFVKEPTGLKKPTGPGFAFPIVVELAAQNLKKNQEIKFTKN